MSDVEVIARAIDPDVWASDTPVPTRFATEEFHRRRQESCRLARIAIEEMNDDTGAE